MIVALEGVWKDRRREKVGQVHQDQTGLSGSVGSAGSLA